VIFPSISKYNAPYRGSRNRKELSNILTSIWYDINVLYKTYAKHNEDLKKNISYSMEGRGEPVSNISANVQINQEEVKYRSINNMVHNLDSIETILDNMLRNL
jgi:hypothetical protein